MKKLWGIGDSTYSSLVKKGISTTETLRKYTEKELCSFFGESNGSYLYRIARGIDPGIYTGEVKSRSISSEETFYPDVYGYDALDAYLLEMSQEVMFRALEEKKVARTVGIKIRYGDFTTTSIQETPQKPIYSSSDVYTIARQLLRDKYTGEGVRLLGISISGIYDGEDVEQKDFFADREEKERKLEKTILSLSQKGSRLIKARNLKEKQSAHL